MTRVCIDPNVRVRANQTFVGFEQVDGMLALGDTVTVYEQETGVETVAGVTEIDFARRLVYLSLDWKTLYRPARSYMILDLSAARSD